MMLAAASSAGLRKDERFVTIADAVAVIETFAEQTQARRVRIQQKPKDDADDGHGVALAAADQADNANAAAGGGGGGSISTITASLGTSSSPSSSASQNIVVLECENAPECKWFVRLSYIKSEKKWKISSMNTTHHKTNCVESKPLNALASSSHNGAFQRMIQDELMAAGNASNAAALLDPTTLTSTSGATPASAGALGSHLYVGLMFMSWKEAISSIRALAQQMGRRAVAEKSTQMIFQGKSITVRRIVCQNHRNSNCEWMIVLDENQTGTDQYTVLSMHLLHSKECLETVLLSKAPRLEFDTDVVTGLTELV
uniref:Uncharacterized protein n=1 Tax=Globisporangium ultimum (strain ATCC 200006 / CBS 805.95 / DAOM BR144) TaxID=431595 RepID=K3WH34_GLOUD